MNRLELLKQSFVVKNAIDAVFLRNKMTAGPDDVMSKAYSKSDLCYICISTTAKAISQIPLQTTQIINQTTGERHALPFSNPWQGLWSRPNYLTDEYSFIEQIVTYLMLDGAVFILPFPPGLSIPDSLWAVPKKYMRPDKDEKTGGLLGWWYNPTGQFASQSLRAGSIHLEVNEVARIYFFNPYDIYDGLAPLEAGRKNITIDYKAAIYTENFFDVGASTSGVLSTEQKLSDKQYARAKEQIESKHTGYRKSYGLMVLEQGLKYTQMGLSQRDMEFGDLRNLSAERIYQIFGMKKAVISVIEDVNYATAREEKREWWEGTNLPIMKAICSALKFTLFSQDKSLGVQFDTTTIAALKEALKDKVNTGYKLWQMGYTANEVNARLDMGFGKKPWRDIGYIAVNIMPVDKTGNSIPPLSLPPAEGNASIILSISDKTSLILISV